MTKIQTQELKQKIEALKYNEKVKEVIACIFIIIVFITMGVIISLK